MVAKLHKNKSDPNQKLTPLQFAFIPQKRLEYDSHYYARVHYRVHGRLKSKEWSFHTKDAPYTLLDSDEKEQSFNVASNQEYIINLIPKDCNDTYKRFRVSHYSTVEVVHRFIDANTIYIKVTSVSKKVVEIDLDGKRTIRLHIL